MNQRLILLIAWLLAEIFSSGTAHLNALAAEESAGESSFHGTIKSGIYDVVNNKFGICIELDEHPGKVFLLTADSNASKSMGTFAPNKRVNLKCRKGVSSDSQVRSPAATEFFHILEFQYVK